jgi:hypothetical protein
MMVASITLATALGDQPGAVAWMTYSQADRLAKSLVKLEESDSAQNVRVAWVRLSKATPANEADSLMIYNANSAWCGSGGCTLTILTRSSNGQMSEIFGVNVGSGIDEKDNVDAGVSLGREFTKGMRNLRFYDSVTWIWSGKTYILK